MNEILQENIVEKSIKNAQRLAASAFAVANIWLRTNGYQTFDEELMDGERGETFTASYEQRLSNGAVVKETVTVERDASTITLRGSKQIHFQLSNSGLTVDDFEGWSRVEALTPEREHSSTLYNMVRRAIEVEDDSGLRFSTLGGRATGVTFFEEPLVMSVLVS